MITWFGLTIIINAVCYFPETTHLLSVGRPIGAILLNLHFATFTDIKSLAIGRILLVYSR